MGSTQIQTCLVGAGGTLTPLPPGSSSTKGTAQCMQMPGTSVWAPMQGQNLVAIYAEAHPDNPHPTGEWTASPGYTSSGTGYSSPAPSGSTSAANPSASYVPPASTNGAVDHVINSGASTSSTLPADSPARSGATSSQASAAAGLPAGSPGVDQMTSLTGGSATSSSSKVGASGATSKTADTAAPASKYAAVRAKFLALFALAWVLFGVAAFFFSLVCFGRSGSFGEKVFGFFLALVFGPFYFVYYFADGAYCRANAPTLF